MTRSKTPLGFVFLTRCYLHLKADLLAALSDQPAEQAAWRALVDYEAQALPWKRPSRSYAMVNLGECMLRATLPNTKAADALLRQAHDIAITDREHYRFAAEAMALRAQIQSGRNDWATALRMHERAEQLFLQSRPLCTQRTDNLYKLAECYTRFERHQDAADVLLKAKNADHTLTLCSPRPGY